jgi:hypothetical protein
VSFVNVRKRKGFLQVGEARKVQIRQRSSQVVGRKKYGGHVRGGSITKNAKPTCARVGGTSPVSFVDPRRARKGTEEVIESRNLIRRKGAIHREKQSEAKKQPELHGREKGEAKDPNLLLYPPPTHSTLWLVQGHSSDADPTLIGRVGPHNFLCKR